MNCIKRLKCQEQCLSRQGATAVFRLPAHLILGCIRFWQLGDNLLHGGDVLLGGNALVVEPKTLLHLEPKRGMSNACLVPEQLQMHLKTRK